MVNRKQRRLRRQMLLQRAVDQQEQLLAEEADSSLGQLTQLLRQSATHERFCIAVGSTSANFIITRPINNKQTDMCRYNLAINDPTQQVFSTQLFSTRCMEGLNDLLCRILTVVDTAIYEISIPMRGCDVAMEILGQELWVVGGPRSSVETADRIREATWSWLAAMIIPPVATARAAAMKEELHAAVWHPRRMAALLEAGGWDAVENLNGC